MQYSRNLVAAIRFVAVILVSSSLLAGCSDPKNYEVTKLTEEQRKELGKKLSADEGKKLAAWMMRNILAGKQPAVGTTVAMALVQQDEWDSKRQEDETRAAALRIKVAADRKEKQEELAKVITTVLAAKKNNAGEYGRQWVGLEVAFENKSDKDIQGIKGVLELADIFGDKILDINWSFDEGAAAKQMTVDRSSGIEINKFKTAHMKLWGTDFEKIKSTFVVSMIIFKDGTKIAVPE